MKGTVRITGGTWKGLRVGVPPKVRPSKGRTREALFSRWQSRLPGAEFLDLYAGTGVVSLEALSRGAARSALGEINARQVKSLRGTLQSWPGLEPSRWEVYRGDCLGILQRFAREARRFSLVWADPPYTLQNYQPLVEAMAGVLSTGGEAAVEHRNGLVIAPAIGALTLVDRRRYGDSEISFFRSHENAPTEVEA